MELKRRQKAQDAGRNSHAGLDEGVVLGDLRLWHPIEPAADTLDEPLSDESSKGHPVDPFGFEVACSQHAGSASEPSDANDDGATSGHVTKRRYILEYTVDL